MPANLGPEYLAAEQEFRAAETPAERIAALEKMLATLPKHKGTEKMQADLRRRLSQARKESQKKGASHAAPFYLVPREGAGQVALVGPPNSGKSSLVAALTHAHPEVADYPFTTRLPLPGMMTFENVQVQLLDLPPIAAGYTEPWLPQAIRGANASTLVVNANDADDLDEIEVVERSLREWRLPRPTLLVANQIDQPGAAGNFAALADLYGGSYLAIAVSAVSGQGLPELRHALFDVLGLVRVYTKVPGHKPELNSPYVLPRGATVIDAARRVHKDFAEHLRFARLFGREGSPEGLMVDRHDALADGDILEFHI